MKKAIILNVPGQIQEREIPKKGMLNSDKFVIIVYPFAS